MTRKMNRRTGRLCLTLALLCTCSMLLTGCNKETGKKWGQKARQGIERSKETFRGFREGYRGN